MSMDSTAFDSVLKSCQHPHCRIVLAELAREQRSLTLNDLTEAVLKANNHTPVEDASSDALKKIRISLVHHHFPKLAAEGCINYDSAHELVEPIDHLAQMQPALSMILDADPTLEAPMELSRQTHHYHPPDELE